MTYFVFRIMLKITESQLKSWLFEWVMLVLNSGVIGFTKNNLIWQARTNIK